MGTQHGDLDDPVLCFRNVVEAIEHPRNDLQQRAFIGPGDMVVERRYGAEAQAIGGAERAEYLFDRGIASFHSDRIDLACQVRLGMSR